MRASDALAQKNHDTEYLFTRLLEETMNLGIAVAEHTNADKPAQEISMLATMIAELANRCTGERNHANGIEGGEGGGE